MCDFTCAQEHDSVVPIHSRDAVYCDLREPILGVDPREDGPAGDRVHEVVHEWVHADKANDIIWEIFSGLYAWVICATRTLYGRETFTFRYLLVAIFQPEQLPL